MLVLLKATAAGSSSVSCSPYRSCQCSKNLGVQGTNDVPVATTAFCAILGQLVIAYPVSSSVHRQMCPWLDSAGLKALVCYRIYFRSPVQVGPCLVRYPHSGPNRTSLSKPTVKPLAAGAICVAALRARTGRKFGYSPGPKQTRDLVCGVF